MSGGDCNTSIARPDPRWVPLREGALKFQRFSHRSQLAGEDVVQRLCDDVANKAGLGEIIYFPEIHMFQIERDEADNAEGESLDGFPASAFATTVVGSFRIGDETVGNEDRLTEAERALVRLAIADLHHRLERGLHLQLRYGRCQLFARVGTPVAQSFTDIPPDVFASFIVVDWRRGIAEAIGSARLFSIHLSEPTKAVATALSAIDPLAGNTLPERFGRFILEKHKGVKPLGMSWPELHNDFAAHIGQPNPKRNIISEPKMRQGLRLAQLGLAQRAQLP